MKDKLKLLLLSFSPFLISGCIQLPFDSNQIDTIQKNSTLHTAVRMNNLEAVKKFVNSSNVNSIDKFGDTPIIDAVRNNSDEITVVLMCNGANLSVLDKNSYSLVDITIRNENNVLMNKILNKKKTCLNYDISKNESIKISNEEKISIVEKNKKTTVAVLNRIQHKKVKEIKLDNKFGKSNISLEEDTLRMSKKSQLQSSLNTIILPKGVTYNNSKNEFTFHRSTKVNNNLKNSLKQFIPSLSKVLNGNEDLLTDIKILSYSSSEYRTKKTLEEKFIANQKLSKKRAIDVVTYITNIKNNSAWIIRNIHGIGMGSLDTIKLADGTEDVEESRRTVLKLVLQ